MPLEKKHIYIYIYLYIYVYIYMCVCKITCIYIYTSEKKSSSSHFVSSIRVCGEITLNFSQVDQFDGLFKEKPLVFSHPSPVPIEIRRHRLFLQQVSHQFCMAPSSGKHQQRNACPSEDLGPLSEVKLSTGCHQKLSTIYCTPPPALSETRQ